MSPSPVIGIVGSAGAYGRWLRDWFARSLQLEVLGSDPADPAGLDPDSLIARSDVLIFSAPVRTSAALIRDYAARAGDRARQQLWMDLTSIKVEPVAAMLASGAEVVGLHPMCAPPKSPTLRGRVMVVCEARLDHWRPWFSRFVEALEADCVRLTADQHDHRMALVQNMVHALHLAQAAAMARFGETHLSPEDLLACRTVGFEADLACSARMLAGNAQLYVDILLGNPHAAAAVQALISELQSLHQRILRGDGEGILADSFERARRWLDAGPTARGNYTFERLGYLLADLSDPRALSVHLPQDRPGSLRELLAVFESLQISLDSVHSSRTPAGEVHFRFGFSRATPDSALQDACARISLSGIGRVLAD